MIDYSENILIEKPASTLFANIGWQTNDCFYGTYGSNSTFKPVIPSEVVLTSHLGVGERHTKVRSLHPDGIGALNGIIKDYDTRTAPT